MAAVAMVAALAEDREAVAWVAVKDLAMEVEEVDTAEATAAAMVVTAVATAAVAKVVAAVETTAEAGRMVGAAAPAV